MSLLDAENHKGENKSVSIFFNFQPTASKFTSKEMLTTFQDLSVRMIDSNIKSQGLKKDVLVVDQLLSLLNVLLRGKRQGGI